MGQNWLGFCGLSPSDDVGEASIVKVVARGKVTRAASAAAASVALAPAQKETQHTRCQLHCDCELHCNGYTGLHCARELHCNEYNG